MESSYFSDQFCKVIMRHKHIGYNLNDMRQSACLVINPIIVDKFAALLIARWWIGPRTKAIHFSFLGPEPFRQLLGPPRPM